MKATYVKTKLTSVVNISRIVTIHYYEFDKSFVFSGETHNFWEMVYIDKGRVEIRADDTVSILSQGEIIFHRPNEFHSIRALDSSPNFFVISFVSDSPIMQYLEKHHTVLNRHLKPYISSIITEAERTFFIPKNDPHLKKLHKKENAPLGGEQLIKTALEQLLIFLIRAGMEAGKSGVFLSKESMENHIAKAVKEYVEERLNEPFRLGDLCAEIGYSKSYLSKLFQEQTGETIASYSVKQKIRKAKQLIREDTLNFTQISAALAFDNPQYFTRVFKRVTGMTPTEFKHSLDFAG